MKKLLFLLCAAVAHQVAFAQIKSSSPDSLCSVLSAIKKATDAYVDRQRNILVYSKVPGNKVPQRVYNDKWPEETEFDYNVVKAKNGKIILISQAPTMESGDWYIAYKYYFDEQGHTYAFEKVTNGFNDAVKDGLIYERQIRYYSPSFKLIKTDYSLTNKDGKPLKSTMNLDLIRLDYKIYKDLSSCRKAFNLPATL